jgi:hypothetical protein
MFATSTFRSGIAMVAMAACGGSPREASRPAAHATHVADAGLLETDPDLNRSPPRTLLAIDWSTVKLDTDDDALALWQRIPLTVEDLEEMLDEIPSEGQIASRLALAFLRQGNFACSPVSVPQTPHSARGCGLIALDVEAPAPDATLADPCMRRLVAMWAISAIDEADLGSAADALRAIAAIPPPESQLVSLVLGAYPESEQGARLELAAIAFRAGHRELVNARLGAFEPAYLAEAISRHHIDGALQVLPVEHHRAVFLTAVSAEQMHASGRIAALTELVTQPELDGKPLPRDLLAALTAAAKSTDCAVAAAASRALVKRGHSRFAPKWPQPRKPADMMRALCVLASYEALQQSDEPSYLPGYVAARGLELVVAHYDPYNEDDLDGDGDPHLERTTTMVPRGEVVLPELHDLLTAFASCKDTTCTSQNREFRFTLVPVGGRLVLRRLEIVELPWCPNDTRSVRPRARP